MKIMYCITRSNWGGAQAHVFELIRDQLKRGNEITLVTGEIGELTNRLKKFSVKVIVLSELKREIDIHNDFQAIFRLRKILKKFKPNILHLHSSKAGLIGRIAAIGITTKVVYTVHGWVFNNKQISKFKQSIYVLAEKLVAMRTDEYLFVSNYDYEIAKKKKILVRRNKTKVVYNGVRKPDFKRSVFLHSPIRIIMIARFSEQKDQKTLINAINQTKNVTLTLVGDGPTLESNQQLVKRLKMENRVKFQGFQNNVSQFLKENDIFALSTHYEGLPISIIEAMSFSMPILATNVDGNSELVINGVNGFTTDGTSLDMENKIKKIINEVEHFGNNSRKIFEKKFQLEKVLDEIDNAYLRITE